MFVLTTEIVSDIGNYDFAKDINIFSPINYKKKTITRMTTREMYSVLIHFINFSCRKLNFYYGIEQIYVVLRFLNRNMACLIKN